MNWIQIHPLTSDFLMMTLLVYLLPCIISSWKKSKHVWRGCLPSQAQQRLQANRSPRYWLMSSVRLQPEECFWFRMTLTHSLVGVGLQSKHVHLDQFLPAGGVIAWGGLQSLKWIKRYNCRTPHRLRPVSRFCFFQVWVCRFFIFFS